MKKQELENLIESVVRIKLDELTDDVSLKYKDLPDFILNDLDTMQIKETFIDDIHATPITINIKLKYNKLEITASNIKKTKYFKAIWDIGRGPVLVFEKE